MSNVASLELCKGLYELSGWSDCKFYWSMMVERGEEVPGEEYVMYNLHDYTNIKHGQYNFPAYDLGYLLRKLPTDCLISVYEQGKTYYCMKDTSGAESTYDVEANTPEDAACKLAIELIKQGVLKP